MGVPNTMIFSLLDIVTDLGGGETSLQECFDNVHVEGFDATYNQNSYAPANSLLRFRNYNYVSYNNHIIYTHPDILETVSFSTSSTGGVISIDGEPDKTISGGSGKSTHIFYVAPAEIELTHVYANNLTSIDHTFAAKFTDVDISGAPDLETFSCVSSNLTSLNTSNNTKLQRLYLGSNDIVSLDLSNNPDLTLLALERTKLTSLDVSGKPNLTSLNMASVMTMNSVSVSQIYIDLDANGASNGNFYFSANVGELTAAGQAAKSSLYTKGWTFT